MAKYIKTLTLDNAEMDVVFPATPQVDTVTFSIAMENQPYGGAKVTLEEGWLYYLLAECKFGTSANTAGQAYDVWIANTNNPMSGFIGAQRNWNQYNSVPTLSTSCFVAPDSGGATVGAYANITNTILGGNVIRIRAFKVRKI